MSTGIEKQFQIEIIIIIKSHLSLNFSFPLKTRKPILLFFEESV